MSSEEKQQLITVLDKEIKDKGYEGFHYFFEYHKTWTVKNLEEVGDYEVIVVLNDFDLTDYINNIFGFCSSLSKAESNTWFQNFTKTMFLFGNPHKLSKRFSKKFAVQTDNLCITKPSFINANKGLKLLLRPISTEGEYEGKDCRVYLGGKAASSGREKNVYINTAGLSFERYLVHLNHIITEAILKGNLVKGDLVHIVHKKRILLPEKGDFLYTRVDIDELDPKELRLYGLVVEETPRFAVRTSNLTPSKTKQFKALVKEEKEKGNDVIDLGHGDTNIQISQKSADLAKKLLEKGRYKYSSGQGNPELIEFLKTKHSVTASQVVVGVGAKNLLDMTMRLVVDPGDEVVVIAPFWPTYATQIKMSGGIPRVFSLEENGNFDKESFSKFVDSLENGRAIILNNPNNPTGKVYSQEEIEFIVELAREKKMYLISDEVYSDFVFGKSNFYSVLDFRHSYDLDRLIMINSASKAYGMSGFRVGYLVSDENFVKKCVSFNSQSISNVPEFTQLIYLSELKDKEHHKVVVDDIKRRYSAAKKAIKSSKYLELGKNSDGSVFLFPSISTKINMPLEEFAKELIVNKQVAVLPGSSFYSKNGLRLCIGKVTPKEINEAVKRIDEFIDEVRA